ncbi:MAG: CRTAC1 family protein [Alphaproteobacteria bacterium]|nr:CRTAC1 family protein [Alphaproteobacteria bacterium]
MSWPPLALLLAGCDPAVVSWSNPNFQLQVRTPVCEDPVEGWPRLWEVGRWRGLDAVVQDDDAPRACPSIPGGLVARDLDRDGDVDLLLNDPEGAPILYANDGAGVFEEVALHLSAPDGRRVESLSAADLDGDGLPELLITGAGFVAAATNRGGLDFDPFEALWVQEGWPRTCVMSLAVGDVDGDGDPDLVLPGADPVDGPDDVVSEDPESLRGDVDRLLLNADGRFTALTLPLGDPEGISLLAAVTDRDADGDLDILLGADRVSAGLSPTAFLRNDGVPDFIDDAEEIGAAVRACAMGVDSADLNDDGRPDYCMSDDDPDLVCLLSDGRGGYAESGASLGLVAGHHEHPDPPEGWGWFELEDARRHWVTWGLELVDLDNDGWDELATVAGGVPNQGNVALTTSPRFQPDALYRRADMGPFFDLSHMQGFSRPEDHYGLVSADFDQDGARDLVVGAWRGRPLFWSNPCNAEAWLEVRLEGPPGDRDAFGAQVTVVTDGRLQVRELHALRTAGQSDAALHFGLGDAEQIDEIEVRWPDGEVTVGQDVPVPGVLTALHPASN